MAIFKDRGSYRLGGKSRLVMNRGARDELRELAMPHVNSAADRIADVCNAASSWGFYKAFHGRQRATVAVLNGQDSERGRRLLAAAQRGGDVL